MDSNSSATGSQAAASSGTSTNRYYCHQCAREVGHIDQESFTCPYCHQGFLEEILSTASERNEPELDDARSFEEAAPNMNDFFRNILGMAMAQGRQQHEQASGQSSTPQATASGGQPRQQQGGRRDNPYLMEGFLQNLVQGLAGGGGGFQIQMQINEDGPVIFGNLGNMGLHGNPGDYAWGPEGLDEVVTRLLNQFEGGAPPMTEEQIRNLPEVEVSQEQVDKRVQCTICMDDFKLNEKVRRLPCGHHFHEPCIVPWLGRHNTCPVCRKAVVDGGATSNTNISGGPTAGGGGAGGGQSGGPTSGGGTGGGRSQGQASSGQSMWHAIDELD